MLKEFRASGLPVPLFDDEYLVDEKGIFGYRMELLTGVDFYDAPAVLPELEVIVHRLHECGLSHGGLHPGNVMRNSSGEVVFIDASSAGRLGQPVPDHIPWYYYDDCFGESHAWEARVRARREGVLSESISDSSRDVHAHMLQRNAVFNAITDQKYLRKLYSRN
jgi:tRNA A-37 threonylcarbamoyl transferase component Bud32